jgi:virginiamycin B lyase
MTILLATVLLGLATATAAAAPIGALKQFKVPTDNSQPRSITNGSDGNRWFTEGTDLSGALATLARVTSTGVITEFPANCNFCILSDVALGPGGILYLTSNDPVLLRFDIASETFLDPVPMPNSSALGGMLAISGDDIWITDFNNDVIWRYRISLNQFTSTAVLDPADVAVDRAGSAWFARPESNGPGTGTIGRIDGVTLDVTTTDVNAAARGISVATDGQVWFSARFTPQAVGRLDPATGTVTIFPLTNTGPQAITAAPDGSMWFTQTTKGNIANITDAGVITEAKVVKGSEPFGIVVAENGHPWYTMLAANKVATLQLR